MDCFDIWFCLILFVNKNKGSLTFFFIISYLFVKVNILPVFLSLALRAVFYFRCNTLIYLETRYWTLEKYSKQYSKIYYRCTLVSGIHIKGASVKVFIASYFLYRTYCRIWQMKCEEDADVHINFTGEENEIKKWIQGKHTGSTKRVQNWRAAGSEERSPKSRRKPANQSNSTKNMFVSAATVPQFPAIPWETGYRSYIYRKGIRYWAYPLCYISRPCKLHRYLATINIAIDGILKIWFQDS